MSKVISTNWYEKLSKSKKSKFHQHYEVIMLKEMSEKKITNKFSKESKELIGNILKNATSKDLGGIDLLLFIKLAESINNETELEFQFIGKMINYVKDNAKLSELNVSIAYNINEFIQRYNNEYEGMENSVQLKAKARTETEIIIP